MAEEILQKLEEQLNCSICLDTYTDPKLLQCMHIYCQQCLVPLVVRDQQGQLSLTCPTDRKVTPIPDRGVAGLQSAFHINHLLEIYEDSVKKLDTPERATPLKEVATHCFEHKGKEVDLYCETCDKLICFRCIMKGGRHYDHSCEELDHAFDKYKKMTRSLQPTEAIVKKALAGINTCCGAISDQRATIEGNIHLTFRRLREVLTVRETELIRQLNHIAQAKMKKLSAQSGQIETTLAKLSSCLCLLREDLEMGQKSDMLLMMTSTVHRVKGLTTPFQLEPNTKADIAFSALPDIDMTAMCQKYGLIFLEGLLDPLQCHIDMNMLANDVYRGVKFVAILQAIDIGGKPYEEHIESLECEFVSRSTRASCSVERKGQSQYEISYQPTNAGRHQLHIKVEGQHVRGSPFSVSKSGKIIHR